MIIETIAIVGLTFVTTTLVAKACERHRDVLYGPTFKPARITPISRYFFD
jgi:hypothetical protein